MNNRQYIDVNKLVSVSRKILKDKRLTDAETSQIEEAVKNMTPRRNIEPVLIIENLDNEEIKQMINNIRKRENIIQQEDQIDKIEQENYELEPETKEILCECEEKLETMKEVIYAGDYVVTERLHGKPKKLAEK